MKTLFLDQLTTQTKNQSRRAELAAFSDSLRRLRAESGNRSKPGTQSHELPDRDDEAAE